MEVKRLSPIAFAFILLLVLSCHRSFAQQSPQREDDYYRLVTLTASKSPSASRSKSWKPSPEGLPLEISGMEFLPDARLAVAIRKGEVWFIDGVYDDPPVNLTYHRFASALHEPLGLLLHQGDLYTAQRTELTRMQDLDGDQVADAYSTVAKGWGVTGNYHEYAFGPALDGKGNLWVTLNLGMGLTPEQKRQVAWVGNEVDTRWRLATVVRRDAIALWDRCQSPWRCVLHRSAGELGRNEFIAPIARWGIFSSCRSARLDGSIRRDGNGYQRCSERFAFARCRQGVSPVMSTGSMVSL